jgi:ferredoxin-thioredoxin reductase catalytic subunit
MSSSRREKIEELYQAARDPAKRAKVLAAADPELRAEVANLLAQDSVKNGTGDQDRRAPGSRRYG